MSVQLRANQLSSTMVEMVNVFGQNLLMMGSFRRLENTIALLDESID